MVHKIVQAVLVVLILAGGIAGASALYAMRTPPKQRAIAEQVLRVEAIEVRPGDVQTFIAGFGEAKARVVVNLVPEVAGLVVETHPRLDVGELIPAGELLFRIDPRNYQAAADQAAAQLARAEQNVKLLQGQFSVDRERLQTAERSAALADAEFGRLKNLFEQNEVGTLSNVERAELSRNQLRDQRDQLAQAVELYPVRIREAQSALDAARAQVDLARANLDRTELRAPFDARIKMRQVEQGQYVAPGAPVLVLADDSLIEISVPLDSRDVNSWLMFRGSTMDAGTAWFGALDEVECAVRWTEGAEGQQWQGLIARVEAFDPRSRTVTVNVRVTAEQARGLPGQLPLVDGMFCSVTIPGQVMRGVYELPDWAVDFDGNAYLAAGDRLEKRPVSVARLQDGKVYVDHGLNPGERVIVTRLVNPLPNSLLNVSMLNQDGSPADMAEAAR